MLWMSQGLPHHRGRRKESQRKRRRQEQNQVLMRGALLPVKPSLEVVKPLVEQIDVPEALKMQGHL